MWACWFGEGLTVGRLFWRVRRDGRGMGGHAFMRSLMRRLLGRRLNRIGRAFVPASRARLVRLFGGGDGGKVMIDRRLEEVGIGCRVLGGRRRFGRRGMSRMIAGEGRRADGESEKDQPGRSEGEARSKVHGYSLR